ncbi:MAG TPA: OmpA family protein, partial [Candidatus Deferrimicrobiaceae bacterium]
DAKIQIEGHCDERGTSEYNMALGERRASAASKYLQNLGIAGSRLSTISYGEERPLDPGHNEDAWAKNRRATFVLQ